MFVSTIKIATRVLLISTLAALALCLLVAPVHPAHASSGGSLSIGSVTGQTTLLQCPAPGSHWASYTTGGTTQYMNCVSARLTGCANALDLNFVYGYLSPSGTVQGVIVYFDGGEGTDPSAEGSEVAMLQYYLGQGYEVVQVAWHTAWEATWNDTGNRCTCGKHPDRCLPPGDISELRRHSAGLLEPLSGRFQHQFKCWNVRPRVQRRLGGDRVLDGLLWSGELSGQCRVDLRAGV